MISEWNESEVSESQFVCTLRALLWTTKTLNDVGPGTAETLTFESARSVGLTVAAAFGQTD